MGWTGAAALMLMVCMGQARACVLTFAYVDQASLPFVSAVPPDAPLPRCPALAWKLIAATRESTLAQRRAIYEP